MFEPNTDKLNAARRAADFALSTIFQAPPPEVCPECGQLRTDDERVWNGMRCVSCAYGWEREREVVGRDGLGDLE